jgi:hypothetical protein
MAITLNSDDNSKDSDGDGNDNSDSSAGGSYHRQLSTQSPPTVKKNGAVNMPDIYGEHAKDVIKDCHPTMSAAQHFKISKICAIVEELGKMGRGEHAGWKVLLASQVGSSAASASWFCDGSKLFDFIRAFGKGKQLKWIGGKPGYAMVGLKSSTTKSSTASTPSSASKSSARSGRPLKINTISRPSGVCPTGPGTSTVPSNESNRVASPRVSKVGHLLLGCVRLCVHDSHDARNLKTLSVANAIHNDLYHNQHTKGKGALVEQVQSWIDEGGREVWEKFCR